MTGGTLRLIADDLTGALDTACEFARPSHPVTVAWAPNNPPAVAGPLAYDTESRGLAEADACRRVAAAAALMGPASGLAFKKIDSALRGHPVAETVAWMQAGGIATAAVIPAFPAQGRKTADGRQWVHEDGRWRLVGPDLAAAFAARGVTACRYGRDGAAEAGGPVAVIVDATTDRAIAGAAADIRATCARPILWCGTGGLAAALGIRSAPLAAEKPEIVIAGSDHEATRRQIAALVRAVGHEPGVMAGAPPGATTGSGVGRPIIIASGPPGEDRAAVAEAHRLVLAGLADRPAPRSILVTGGKTLHTLCEAVGARHLACLGRITPGVAVSAIVGGAWDGCRVISKSGGFGDTGLLARLCAAPPNPGLGLRSPKGDY